MPEWGVALIGVFVGFVLNEVVSFLKRYCRLSTYLKALNDELEANKFQIRQKKEIAEQILQALEKGHFLPGKSVPFASLAYSNYMADLVPKLSPIERDNVKHIYGNLLAVDEIMSSLEESFRTDHQAGVMENVSEAYKGKVRDIIANYDVISHLIDRYLKGQPEDIYHRNQGNA